MRGDGGCGVSDNEYSCAHGAQVNFGDLTPYLTFDLSEKYFQDHSLTQEYFMNMCLSDRYHTMYMNNKSTISFEII
jgi:hypothetical protein